MMIEADVLLRGQNTASQQMIPVMARPPNVTSDITLVEWLILVKGRGKGLKLDFKSIEAVEISLQRLNEIKQEVCFPVAYFLQQIPAVIGKGRQDVPHTSWLATVKNNLSFHSLTVEDAT